MVSNTRLTLNLQYPNIAQVAYAMQGDRLSRAVVADLIDGSTPWAPPAGAYGLITASKPDGTFAVYDTLEDGSPAIVIDGSTVTLYLAEQVLADAGAVKMSVAFFTAAGARLTTFRWTEVVAPEAVLDRVISENYISVFTATMDQIADDLDEAQTILDAIKAAYGAPLTANTADAMTDTSRVYVYIGTTTSTLTNGHWYYWNGSAWTDGGVYNSVALETDKTLSIEGMAADAKATGAVMHNLRATNIALLDEIVKSSLNYDASRINNGQTIDSTTGDAYNTPGRCMTNVLNGTLYPMDAVYIDSTDYCIRLFGYSAQPVSSSTYLGCTDYIAGGKGNVLYRDPSWNICRMVITRNPTTDYTVFTTAEIADIAAKLNLLKFADLQDAIQQNSSEINYNVTGITNYTFDDIGNYEASRINNGKTVDSTTGDAYNTPGRCMTNVLNGTLYPMDAVYIDSTDYCIRLFGYSAQPVSSSTYLGCTDYIVGGAGNVLYRDPAWNICRLVIARNPITDSTAFTTAEIEDIAEKLNLLKKQDKSIDTDYLDYRLLGLHTIPRNAGELNVIKRARQLTDMKWTSEINLPRVSMIDSDNYDSPANYVDDVFLANTEYTGVPYSSRNFVGANVGINSFVTAMYNSQRSTMKDSEKVDRDTAAMYGTACVVLTSYALNLPVVASSYYHLIPDFTLIGTVPSTVNDLQLGDVIIEASHTALITDIILENNAVKYVEVSESTKHGLENADKQGMQWGGICRRKLWTVSDYVRWFGNFGLYRYSKIASVPYEENEYINIGDGLGFRKNPYLACMPYEGDYWWYSRSASSVDIVILDTHYSSLVVYKDGTQLATYPITAQTESMTVSLDGAGYYTANLLDSNDHASGSCHWLVNTNTDISYTIANGIVSFTVKRDIDTPPVSVRFNKVNDNPVFSYHIHPVENLQKSFADSQYVYTFTVPFDVETIQNYNVYLDAGGYGAIVIDRTVS